MDTLIRYRGGYWYEIQSLPVGRLQAKVMKSSGIRDGWFFRSGEQVDEGSLPLWCPILGWTGSYHNVFLGYCAHWLAAILFAVLAALPWVHKLRFRFSLRTLLTATTLVAVVLGLVVWAVRK